VRIVLCYPVEARHLRQIRDVAPDAETVNASQAQIAAELLSADVFCGHAKVPVPWDESSPGTSTLDSVDRGRHRPLLDAFRCALGHSGDRASGLFADQVAEQTLALLLGLLRGLPTFFRQQQARQYVRRPTGDLHGACVGIVGFGGNGRRLPKSSPLSAPASWPPIFFLRIRRRVLSRCGLPLGSTICSRGSTCSSFACRLPT